MAVVAKPTFATVNRNVKSCFYVAMQGTESGSAVLTKVLHVEENPCEWHAFLSLQVSYAIAFMSMPVQPY